jgi:hypothetical protein
VLLALEVEISPVAARCRFPGMADGPAAMALQRLQG